MRRFLIPSNPYFRPLPAVLAVMLLGLSNASAAPPRSLDNRLEIRLFAESPQIVTPTGLDVDAAGRVWVIESNTHFPPENYSRHSSDRLLVMSDSDGDGRADGIVEFADGLRHAMSVAVRDDGGVYVVTRKEIFLLHDEDGDLQADSRRRIVHLDTPGDYPHNGLAGLAFDALDWMYFGLGENLGADYSLVGSDGATLSGGGEGGSLYRCRLDGSKLTRWATGFWNPHASCVDAFGRVFTVDNDPDSRPPCRLLHIIPDGDYGYRFRNGRRGIHPFTAWNGEIPGTLPMVAGTGEAPSGIVAYESAGLPGEYVGNLLVTSWGDYRIDRFRLEPRGTSFAAVAEPLIVGGDDFRPVALAVAPDGSLFCSDWVLKDYQLHGRGRVWHVTATEAGRQHPLRVSEIDSFSDDRAKPLLDSARIDVRRAAARRLACSNEGSDFLRTVIGDARRSTRTRIEALWALCGHRDKGSNCASPTLTTLPVNDDEVATAYCEQFGPASGHRDVVALLQNPDHVDPLFPLALLRAAAAAENGAGQSLLSEIEKRFTSSDPFVFRSTVVIAGRHFGVETLAAGVEVRDGVSSRARLGYLLAAREKDPSLSAIVERALYDPDAEIARAAVQWTGEEGLTNLRPELEGLVSDGGVTADLFRAALASLEILDGVERAPSEEWDGSQYVWSLVADKARPPQARARALSMLPPNDPRLTAEVLRGLLAVDDEELRLEAVRTLQHSHLAEAPELLRRVVDNKRNGPQLRAEAILGLAASAGSVRPSASTLDLLFNVLLGDERLLQIEAARGLRGLMQKSDRVKPLLLEAYRKLESRLQSDHHEDTALASQFAMALGTEPSASPTLRALRSGRPRQPEEWMAVLAERGDPQAGRRVFFDANGAGCFRCHTVHGRGRLMGPDLSMVARAVNRQKLAESILDPSKEIAPQFTSLTVVTHSGKLYHGLLLEEDRSGLLRLGTAEGEVVKLHRDDVQERNEQNRSIMPDKLAQNLTVDEFRDLVAYLSQLK